MASHEPFCRGHKRPETIIPETAKVFRRAYSKNSSSEAVPPRFFFCAASVSSAQLHCPATELESSEVVQEPPRRPAAAASRPRGAYSLREGAVWAFRTTAAKISVLHHSSVCFRPQHAGMVIGPPFQGAATEIAQRLENAPPHIRYGVMARRSMPPASSFTLGAITGTSTMPKPAAQLSIAASFSP